MLCQHVRTAWAVVAIVSGTAGGFVSAAQAGAAGFEQAPPGELRRLQTAAGTFVADAGHAAIDPAHARTGVQCLRLLGGQRRTVEFVPNYGDAPPAFFRFYAERWTRRTPFEFDVSMLQNGDWTEAPRGDAAVRIGDFTAVSIPLRDKPERFRIACTSPPNAGVLLDDFSLVPATPQRVTAVTVEDHVVPIFAGAEGVPALRIRVEAAGTLEPIAVTGLEAALSPIVGVKRLRALAGDAAFGSDADQSGRFKGRQVLEHGVNDFWIVADARPEVDLDATFTATCSRMQFSDGTEIVPERTASRAHRFGVALRTRGQDGVHTSRIPGLATTNDGTLLAVYDLRRRSGSDLPGDIDVGLSRSTDGGRTWEPTRTILDMGDDPAHRFDGVGDPCILVDRQTGSIWVAAVWSHGDRGWHGSGPGLTPTETGQFVLVRSDDDGRTWSEPINITKQIKRPEWAFLLQGPGKGITMQDGTLVFPAQYQNAPADGRLPHSTIVYSRDRGATWDIGTGAFPDTTEAQVVELAPGELMLNARYNREPRRVVTTTRNLGGAWTERPTSRKALIEPGACMASLINVDRELGGENADRLLFSNPASLSSRSRITIKASADGGETWSEGLLLDADRGAGYSCLSMIDDATVGILYEGSRAQMTFQRVALKDLFPKRQFETSEPAPSR